MFRYIKELILPISKKYPSGNESKQTFTVSFKKTEKSLICQGDVEGRSCGQENSSEGKGHIQRCSEKFNEATALLVEKMSTPFRDLVPGIANPYHLKNLTDLRAGEEFKKLQNTTIDDSQPQPRCEEVPRQFVFEEPVSDNLLILPSSKNLAEPTHKKRGGHKENELDMQRMLCNIKTQRDLRKAKANLESSPDKMMDHLLGKTTVVSKQSENIEIEINKILNDILKSRESVIKESEKNELQENKTGLINIDDVLEYEKNMRDGKITNDNTKSNKIHNDVLKCRELVLKESEKNEVQENKTGLINIDNILEYEKNMRDGKIKNDNTKSNKILNDVLKSRELVKKESEKNEVQENKTGLINIDNILEYEKNMRDGKITNDNTKSNKILNDVLKSRELVKKESEKNEVQENKTGLINIDNILEYEKNMRDWKITNDNTKSNKMLNDILKSRELVIKESEKNKVQENKTGLINIDNILEYEKNMRDGKIKNDNTKSPCEEETIKQLKRKPEDHLTTNPQEKNYFNSLLEINRMVEYKMMKSKEKRTEIIEKHNDLKELRLNPTVKTNINEIEIKKVQVIKLKPDTNKEHTIGITGCKALENTKKQK